MVPPATLDLPTFPVCLPATCHATYPPTIYLTVPAALPPVETPLEAGKVRAAPTTHPSKPVVCGLCHATTHYHRFNLPCCLPAYPPTLPACRLPTTLLCPNIVTWEQMVERRCRWRLPSRLPACLPATAYLPCLVLV